MIITFLGINVLTGFNIKHCLNGIIVDDVIDATPIIVYKTCIPSVLQTL